MEQKKMIIIGASSGIGREIASIYVGMGWKVGITGRRYPLLQQFEEQHPGQVVCSSFDVMGEENQPKMNALINALGGLDLLIYNAGFGDVSKDLLWNIEERTTRTNVMGFVEIVCYAFNFFAKKGSGQIAVVSSVAALRGNSWAPSYSASKAFMSRYAEGLNIKADRMKKKIVVTDIKPGFIDTKMAKGEKRFWMASPQKAAHQIVKAIQKKRRKVYITRRWWLIAQILKILPYVIYKRLG
ncbi:MAG: SDR family NAD(P)-dependent oxidoreductase [Flavisolibacter sp.]